MSAEVTKETISNIYRNIGNRESKEIYANRLMYSLTGDYRYILNIVENTVLYKKLRHIFQNDIRPKYIFGAGTWGKQIAELYREFGFAGFIDSYIRGRHKEWEIISLGEFLEKRQYATIYISSTKYHIQQYEQLVNAGISEENIVDIGEMILEVWNEYQYFDLPELESKRDDNEVFVDGGCYDGANSIRFVKWAKGNCMIWAFEPDTDNLKKCERVFGEIGFDRHALINKGLWSSETQLCFANGNNEGSRLLDEGEPIVDVTSLDKVINEKVTFIKLDIEGAEYEALLGAKHIITEYRPKLAVSIYHKPNDIWELPELIMRLNPHYKLFLRHYSLDYVETVLYAI